MKYTTRLPAVEFADPLIRLREEGVEGYPPGLNWITLEKTPKECSSNERLSHRG